VGDVPRGLPSLEVPDVNILLESRDTIAVAASASCSSVLADRRRLADVSAARHGYRIDITRNRWQWGHGERGRRSVPGMPVFHQLSASSLNDQSGARTGLASLTSGVVVLLTLLVLAPLFSDLPSRSSPP